MTANKPEFVYVTYISTTPEKVWNALLLDRELTKLFWGMHCNVSDWKVGSSWSHQDAETGAVAVTGTVLESDPPRRLVLTWESAQMKGSPPTRVTFDIEPFMDAVRLTITQDLDPNSPMYKAVTSGWPAIFSSLKTLLETGQPMPMTTRRWNRPPT